MSFTKGQKIGKKVAQLENAILKTTERNNMVQKQTKKKRQSKVIKALNLALISNAG